MFSDLVNSQDGCHYKAAVKSLIIQEQLPQTKKRNNQVHMGMVFIEEALNLYQKGMLRSCFILILTQDSRLAKITK